MSLKRYENCHEADVRFKRSAIQYFTRAWRVNPSWLAFKKDDPHNSPRFKKQLSPLCKEIQIDREKGEGICKHEASVTPDQILSEANKTGFKTSRLN